MSEYHILVNREHPLSKDYVPGDLKEACFPFLAEPGDPKRLLRQTACQAAQKLFTRAQGQGLLCAPGGNFPPETLPGRRSPRPGLPGSPGLQ